MQDIEDAYRLIGHEMKAMEEQAATVLSSVDPFVEEAVRYSFRIGGKRLRPALLFLAGKAVGAINEKHVRAASAIEMVHTASLIHDDIIDGASVRRHLATVNVRWSAQVGVLAGDLMLTKAMELMTEEDEMHGFRRLTDACRRTCEGELHQIGTIGRFDMTVDEYFTVIAGKTAPLLACSSELGAWYAGADRDTVERFRMFGLRLGLAFQMIDDILDLVGETDTTGKTLRTDLVNRKPTLPLILYLRSVNGTERNDVLATIRNENFDEQAALAIARKLCDSGVVREAREVAKKEIDEAIESISRLDADPEAVAGLVAIARFVGNRKK